MRQPFRGFILLGCGTAVLGLASAPPAAETPSAQRGREFVLHRPFNPGIWSRKALDTLWKQWGVPAKPADYARALQERYGLLPAPFVNSGLPLGLIESRTLFGKGLVNNCLLCHAGSVAGQTYLGLGNASLELQGLFEELTAADGLKMPKTSVFSNVRGTVDPVNPLIFMMEFRDADLNVQPPVPLGYSAGVCSDPPAWWLLKKKKTRDWTGSIDARSTRVDMVNLLTPLNGPETIKGQAAAFADISAFLHTLSAPRYPFPVDGVKAARGERLFRQNCARCHGTYGPGGSYPNKIVPLGTLGTDRTLALAVSRPELVTYFNRSWFAQEMGPDGKPYQIEQHLGYQAPPLDGIWATAPYFHNGSVPTVYHVLNSRARPRLFTRSFRTGREDYDPVKLGWKFTVLDQALAPTAPAIERRKVYDTTLPGRGNAGHTFGDKLSDDERLAVIEYLKTL